MTGQVGSADNGSEDPAPGTGHRPVTARGRVRPKAAASAGLSPFWEASTCALVRVCDVLWRNVEKPASDGNPSRLAPYGGVVALQVGMTHGTTAFSGRCRRCTRRIFTRGCVPGAEQESGGDVAAAPTRAIF